MLRPLIFRTLVTNLVIGAVGLLNSVLLSRWLGPGGRGDIAAAMLWPTLLVYLSSLGLISAILYFAALPESRPPSILANATLLAIVQGVLAVVVGFVAMPLLLHSQTDEVIRASRLFLLVAPLSLMTQYGASILQGLMHISKFNWLRAILPAGYLIGTISLMAAGRLGLFSIIILHICLNAVTGVATLIALMRSDVRPVLAFDGQLAKRMLKYGAKVHVGNVSGIANMSLDQALMAALLPSRYLGLYVVAVSAASLPQVFSQAVQMVSTPSIAQRGSSSERISVLQGVFRRYWLLGLLISALIAALLPVLMPLVFGVEFAASVWPAEVLLVGTFFLGAQAVLAGGAQALGNPWLSSKANIGALIVTVVLLYILLPLLGIMGAAIATTAAYLAQLMIVVFGLRYSHGVSLSGLFRVRSKELSSALDVFGLMKGHRERLASDQG